MGLYPFKVRIKDPQLAGILKMVNQKRAVKIPDIKTAQRAGIKLKPIRRDIFIGTDIALPPEIDLDFIKKGNSYDFIFKNIF